MNTIPGVDLIKLFFCKLDHFVKQTLNVNYAESRKQAHYAQCRYAECHDAECRGAKIDPFLMGLDHPLDGITNPKYKLLHFLTTNFFAKRKRH